MKVGGAGVLVGSVPSQHPASLNSLCVSFVIAVLCYGSSSYCLLLTRHHVHWLESSHQYSASQQVLLLPGMSG